MLVILSSLEGEVGISFVTDREDYFSQNVEFEGDTVHFSFVVIPSDALRHFGDEGVDLVVLSA